MIVHATTPSITSKANNVFMIHLSLFIKNSV